jgi:hypothetical protein
MCKKFSSHAWCILALKCLALNIRNFGRQSVWHWFIQWTLLLTNSLPYIALVEQTCIVQMPVSELGWIRTLHKRKCEEAFWTVLQCSSFCAHWMVLESTFWLWISSVSCIADIVFLVNICGKLLKISVLSTWWKRKVTIWTVRAKNTELHVKWVQIMKICRNNSLWIFVK